MYRSVFRLQMINKHPELKAIAFKASKAFASSDYDFILGTYIGLNGSFYGLKICSQTCGMNHGRSVCFGRLNY